MNLLLVDGFVEVDVWWMKKEDGQKWERRLFVVVEGLASDVLPSAGFSCVSKSGRERRSILKGFAGQSACTFTNLM